MLLFWLCVDLFFQSNLESIEKQDEDKIEVKQDSSVNVEDSESDKESNVNL